MSEKRWYRIHLLGKPDDESEVLLLDKKPDVGFWRYDDVIKSIEEVEVRPLRQEKCEWEKMSCGWDDIVSGKLVTVHGTNGELLLRDGRKYCPECGRRLEEARQ